MPFPYSMNRNGVPPSVQRYYANEVTYKRSFFSLKFNVFNVPSVARTCLILPHQDVNIKGQNFSILHFK